ncbi:hypothetical protein [Thermoactinospora rubra]|uniref:hypothetical protein n=1 Tax=Thermoactinospora rubra TaxID=1088767 RepID=UPI000A11F7C7|nr:hypothetical protein [Thermoactinospora rubra]
MENVVRWTLVLIGLVTATPAVALVSAEAGLSAYRLAVPGDPMTLALLQHRGVLQAALGAAIVWAAFRPWVRIPVAVTAIATKGTFLALVLALGGASRAITGVAFDVVAIALLVAIAVRQARIIIVR